MPQTTVPDHRGRAERPEEPGRPGPADRAGDGAGEPPRFPLPNTTPWRPYPRSEERRGGQEGSSTV